MMKQASNAMTRDAALIVAAQRVEHYEMAGYGTLVSYAQQLDHKKVVELLQQTLNEEKQTDLMLSQIAESKVNVKAK
jgi:ferritin-like metal-binding protein YciE